MNIEIVREFNEELSRFYREVDTIFDLWEQSTVDRKVVDAIYERRQ